ncbi:serine/threonine-protein kinase [Streptomyces sp. NBC_01497]|uniref:serine/threonine-protein kinase n=1 Tax=Streptomyces sp. NBC_01497 TaxID=2903885 RepID=UPI002E30FACF|nr:protein kinase [Streptomyces sp. NBC_01497]
MGSERLIADRYRLLGALGEGGMGTVWRAHDETLQREVAVKEVRAPTGLSGAKVELMYTRLQREAWAAARINASNVITVHDVVTDDGRPWIVMELVQGGSLADLLRTRGALPAREAARIGANVVDALRAAHTAGVLHRDVKPANVLLSEDGRVVLSDFGIAMVEGDTSLTMTGELVGSPEYLAPERALGRAPGPESDLWSVGVLLYAAVQGRAPFRKDTALSTLRAVVDDDPAFPDKAGPLAAVLEGLLRKDPAERASAGQVARDLRLIADGALPDTVTTPRAPLGESPPPIPSLATENTATDTVTAARPDGPSERQSAVPSMDTDTLTSAGAIAVTGAGTGTAPVATDDTSTAVRRATFQRHNVVPPSRISVTPEHQAAPSAPLADPLPPIPPTATTPHPLPSATPSPAAAGSAASGPRSRDRRRTYVRASTAAAAVLLLAGVGYALTSGEGQSGEGAGVTAATPAAGTGRTPGSASHTAADSGSSASARQPVTVNVTGANTAFTGACPPSAGQAPTFTATFNVVQLPMQFSYRWVSSSGAVVDPDWRTLSFPEGGPHSHQETVSLTTYAGSVQLRSAMAVEIKSPLHAVSNTVPFSLSCADPADETSLKH